MSEQKKRATRFDFLPGIEPDNDMSRKSMLKLWMRQRGWTYKGLAESWDCHWTFPGKCLDAEAEELPAEKRQWMIDNNFPEELLPPSWSKQQKQKHNKIRVERRRDLKRQEQADKFKRLRQERRKAESEN